jgi:hypothetical protein
VQFLYLAALAISLTGMIVLDRRFRLFFWNDARRATIVLVVGVVFFLVWDLSGIDGYAAVSRLPYRRKSADR